MSTLQTANITDGTNSVETVYVARGSAKAWVNFDGTGTIAARDSLNLSSLTDDGTGLYTVNFSSAFGAGDYASQGTKRDVSSLADGHVNLLSQPASGSSIGAVEAGGYVDTPLVALAVYGDLA